MQYCPSCETELPDAAHFCRQCGYPLTATTVISKVTSKRASSSADALLLNDSAADAHIPPRKHKVPGILSMPVKLVVGPLLAQIRDPEPEVSHARHRE